MIKKRLGRRGLCLVLLGVLCICIGIGNLTTGELPATTTGAIQIALYLFSIQVWGGVFLTVGIISVISSFYPPGHDALGFILITGLMALWGCVYLFGWIFFHSPRAWLTAAIFFAVTALTQVIAGWNEE